MRVCLSPGTLGDGGIGMHTVTLAEAFAAKGVATDIFLTQASGPRLAKVPEGVQVHEGGGRARNSVPMLVRYLRRERPALLLSSRHHVHVLSIAARKISSAPTAVACIYHTYEAIDTKHKSLAHRLHRRMAAAMARSADVLVAVSNGVARDVERRLRLEEGKVRTIYNPAWSDSLAAQIHACVDHPWLGHGRSFRTVVGMGRLTKQKDFPTLLRAVARIGERVDVRLVVLGEGEDREDLERLAAGLGIGDRVSFPGHVPNPVSHLARADLFVLSSAWEGFGNVIVEALGAGTPVVSTDCPSGPSEILAQGRFGRLVPVGDHLALAEAILQELAEPRAETVLKARAREFSADRIASEYLELAG